MMRLNANSIPLAYKHYNTTWVQMSCSFSSIDGASKSLIQSDVTLPGLSGYFEDELKNGGNDISDSEVIYIVNSGG